MTFLEIITPTKTIYDFYNRKNNNESFDLYCIIEEEILPGEIKFIDLGIRCKMKRFNACFWEWFKNKSIWKNCKYIILPHVNLVDTPLLMKNSIYIIETNYIGSLKIPVINFSADSYTIKKGDCLFQLNRFNFKPVVKKLK